jgi:hypothetical protein
MPNGSRVVSRTKRRSLSANSKTVTISQLLPSALARPTMIYSVRAGPIGRMCTVLASLQRSKFTGFAMIDQIRSNGTDTTAAGQAFTVIGAQPRSPADMAVPPVGRRLRRTTRSQ